MNEHCPSDEFEYGMPSGGCWGNGHYQCRQCKHFRCDFVNNQQYVDYLHERQAQIQILTLNKQNNE